MNIYQKTAKEFQERIHKDIDTIYKLCSNGLMLKLAEENLLELKDNCIQSSTAIGYCMEEFIVKKLLKLDNNFYNRNDGSTQNSSFDLYVIKNNIKILINLKANKKNNNAISALGQLYKDYISTDRTKEKIFMVFKSNYFIEDKMIKIKNTNSFYLEQCNFEFMKTDNRSWSKNNDNLSGRIQYNDKTKGLINIENISYEGTVQKLNNWIEQKRNER